MIYSISGLLRQVAPTYCVVEACGVGYQCSASTHTLSSLPGRGQEVTLLTHLWVKEDGMELFGFSTEQERRCFRMLIGVSGVACKPLSAGKSVLLTKFKSLTRNIHPIATIEI